MLSTLIIAVVIVVATFVAVQSIQTAIHRALTAQVRSNDPEGDVPVMARDRIDATNDWAMRAATRADALAEALSRVRETSQLRYLMLSYEAIAEYRLWRARGKSDAEVATSLMTYSPPGYVSQERGVSVPSRDERTSKLIIMQFSPYRIATEGLDFEAIAKARKERSAELANDSHPLIELSYALFGWSPSQEDDTVERRLMPDTYLDDDGKPRQYPPRADDESPSAA